MRHTPDRRETIVTSADFQRYLEQEALPVTRLDDESWRFQVRGNRHLNGSHVVHPVDAVYQGDGDWSVTTPIARVPAEDSVQLSAVFREALQSRARTKGTAGPFIESDMLVVGVDPTPGSCRELVSYVEDVAQTAATVLEAAVLSADAHKLQLPWL